MPPKRPVSDDESEYDDLDELISEDEDDKTTTGVAALLKGSLSEPRHVTTSVEHINKMIQQGDIELCPSYQRDVVWPEVKMIMLIQSLFLNYYIPPIIFAIETDEIGVDKKICIDGKQRCTSIANFMTGQIPFISPYTKEKYWYVLYENKRNSKELPVPLRKKFDNIQLSLVEYREITDQQQRDVFQRVQMGVSLSAAEKLAAIPGPWPTWIVELLKKYVGEVGTLGTAIAWDQSRGRPFQIVAGFVLMALDPAAKATIPSAQMLNKFLHRADPPDKLFKHKIEMALSLFVKIATEHFGDSFGVVEPRVAPVEWCYTALLIFTRMGVLSVSSLAKAIGKMRTYIRHERGHRDVRSNTRVCADFAEYLRKLPKSRPSSSEVPAAEEFEGDEVDPRDIRAAKRARRGEDTDPTYRGTATDRYDEAGLGRSTRAAVGASASTRTAAPALPSAVDVKPRIDDSRYAPPPPPPAQKPPAPAMDRPMPPWPSQPTQQYNNGGYGSVPLSMQSTNPYTQRYQDTQQAHQHHQLQQQQQQQQQMSYQQAQQQQQQPQYTPQQLAQFQAMQATQARQQAAANGGPRWTDGR